MGKIRKIERGLNEEHSEFAAFMGTVYLKAIRYS
jgi:hypothetical protein